MISNSPDVDVQRAIYERLKADAQLMGMVTDVFDEVPETAPYPYIRIGEALSIPDNAHGEFGRNITHTVHVWTKARSNKPGGDIAKRVGQLLDHRHRDLVVAGHRVVSIRQEFDQALRDPNPEIRHHVVRFRIKTAQQEE